MAFFCNEDDYYKAVCENRQYGKIKTKRPSKEGYSASVDALDYFANASDGELKRVRPSIHDSFPGRKTEFKDVDSRKSKENSDCCLSDYSMFGIDDTTKFDNMMSGVSDTSFNDLATDDPVDQIKESATGWNDLF